jgi:hypothetical protein
MGSPFGRARLPEGRLGVAKGLSLGPPQGYSARRHRSRRERSGIIASEELSAQPIKFSNL